MIKANRFLFFTILISIIIHILVLVVYNYFIKKDIRSEEKNYTEVEYLPSPEKQPEPPPMLQNQQKPKPPIDNRVLPPIDDNRETTLDHDKLTSDKQPKEVVEEDSRSTVSEPVIKDNDERAFIDSRDILDTRSVTERIANQRSIEKKKGEDTASYNKFQERYASYFGKFRTRVYQIWQYPPEAIARGETGVVAVTFSILKDGSIVNIRMMKSSGSHSLDREVMRVLKSMGKIPLPQSYELDQLNIDEAYFYYNSNEDITRWIR